MAIRNLTHFSDPLFRKVSRAVVNFDARLLELLDDMRDTLVRAQGYGCAAVHVGVLRRVVVILEETNTLELINPVITVVSNKVQRVREGSIAPGAPNGYVLRPQRVLVAAVDRFGAAVTLEGEGFLAATLCHEIDHLDGVLFSDKFEADS